MSFALFGIAMIFDFTTEILSKSLDMYLVRHAVIADNLANAETPDYKARRVEFEAQLQRAAQTEVIDDVRAQIEYDAAAPGRDGNTVDMDREMAAMTKNDIKYSAATQAVNRKFALLKYAITDGAER